MGSLPVACPKDPQVLVLPADAADAVSLYRHFAATGPISEVIVGNELDAGDPPGMDALGYARVFNDIAEQIHAEDPDVAGDRYSNFGTITPWP